MITLQFVRGRDAGAALIEWFGHGAEFSHVDTVWPDGRLFGARSDSVGGAPPGVQFRDPSYVDGEAASLRVDLACSNDITMRYLAFLKAQEGKPYDMEGILAFVAGRQWDEPSAWFCSELAAAGLQVAGYFPHPLATSSNKITPPDLVLVLSAFVDVRLAQ